MSAMNGDVLDRTGFESFTVAAASVYDYILSLTVGCPRRLSEQTLPTTR